MAKPPSDTSSTTAGNATPAAGSAQSVKSRQDAREFLKRCEVRLQTLGAAYSSALNTHTANSFAYVRGLLKDESSPTDWLKDGVALWVSCYQTQIDLCDTTCKALSPAHGDDTSTAEAIVKEATAAAVAAAVAVAVGPQTMEFELDQFSQAATWKPTKIPSDQFKSITCNNLVNTNNREQIISKNHVSVQRDKDVVVVSLTGIRPAEVAIGTYSGTIDWGPAGAQQHLTLVVKKKVVEPKK
jgi:hypothetical protein